MNAVELSHSFFTLSQSKGKVLTTGPRLSSAKVAVDKLQINFSVPASRGYNNVSVNIGDADICAMMYDLAARRPDLAARFAECTSIAIQNLNISSRE